jgi:hypothetical protein
MTRKLVIECREQFDPLAGLCLCLLVLVVLLGRALHWAWGKEGFC